MKKHVYGFLSAALVAAGILFSASSTALAHSMPFEEATLVLDDTSGGQIELTPLESTLGDVRTAFDRAGLAEGAAENEYRGGGMHSMRLSYCNYNYNFAGDANIADSRPALDLPLEAFQLYDTAVRTRSGFCVGTSYADVVEAYGEASAVEREERTLLTYLYEFEERRARLLFYVDDDGVIRYISFRSDDPFGEFVRR